MMIRLKVAQSSQELEELYELRAQVYAEQGYFGAKDGNRRHRQHLVDRFDTYPYCANIIAYSEEGEPIGTLRINMDTGSGLPADEYFDFAPHCREISKSWKAQMGADPRVVCAGMLAVRKQWRGRTKVIRSLFEMAGTIAREWGITHVITTVNHQNHSLYERIGFKALSDRIWIELIGEHIVPMTVQFEQYYQWAVSDLPKNRWAMSPRATRHQRLSVKAGEYVFKEGDKANEAYLIDQGCIKIIRRHHASHSELILALLTSGDVFGELEIINSGVHVSSAVAVSNTQLSVLLGNEFHSGLAALPNGSRDMLHALSARLNHMDELALVLAYGSDRQRLQFALKGFRQAASEDRSRVGVYAIKIGPVDLAKSAGVSEIQAQCFLTELVSRGLCEFDDRQIYFLYSAADPISGSPS